MFVRSLIMERMSRLSMQTWVVSRMEAHDVAATLDGLGGKQGVGSESQWCKDWFSNTMVAL